MSNKKRKSMVNNEIEAPEENIMQTSSSPTSRNESILELPMHLNMEILSRLAIKTLLFCRCVCKTWRSLLSDPHFTKLHLSRTPFSLLYKTIPRQNESRYLQMIDIRGAETRCSINLKLKLTLKANLPTNPNYNKLKSPSTSVISFLNSCNGLLCLGDSSTREPIHVCNPILGEYISLPRLLPKQKGSRRCLISGIGYCSETNQYKVLRIFYAENGDTRCSEIYTLGGDGKWKNLGNLTYPYGTNSSWRSNTFNTYVNGALHWLGGGGKDRNDYIHYFHFGTEGFGVILPPNGFDDILGFMNYLTLGELNGCLYVINNDLDSSKVEVWIMNDYGVHDFWCKKIVIQNYIPEDKYCDIFIPIMITDSGEILIIYNNRYVLLYNPDVETYRHLTHSYGIRSKLEAIAHVPSFLSLKDVAMGEEVFKICRT